MKTVYNLYAAQMMNKWCLKGWNCL